MVLLTEPRISSESGINERRGVRVVVGFRGHLLSVFIPSVKGLFQYGSQIRVKTKVRSASVVEI